MNKTFLLLLLCFPTLVNAQVFGPDSTFKPVTATLPTFPRLYTFTKLADASGYVLNGDFDAANGQKTERRSYYKVDNSGKLVLKYSFPEGYQYTASFKDGSLLISDNRSGIQRVYENGKLHDSSAVYRNTCYNCVSLPNGNFFNANNKTIVDQYFSPISKVEDFKLVGDTFYLLKSVGPTVAVESATLQIKDLNGKDAATIQLPVALGYTDVFRKTERFYFFRRYSIEGTTYFKTDLQFKIVKKLFLRTNGAEELVIGTNEKLIIRKRDYVVDNRKDRIFIERDSTFAEVSDTLSLRNATQIVQAGGKVVVQKADGNLTSSNDEFNVQLSNLKIRALVSKIEVIGQNTIMVGFLPDEKSFGNFAPFYVSNDRYGIVSSINSGTVFSLIDSTGKKIDSIFNETPLLIKKYLGNDGRRLYFIQDEAFISYDITKKAYASFRETKQVTSIDTKNGIYFTLSNNDTIGKYELSTGRLLDEYRPYTGGYITGVLSVTDAFATISRPSNSGFGGPPAGDLNLFDINDGLIATEGFAASPQGLADPKILETTTGYFVIQSAEFGENLHIYNQVRSPEGNYLPLDREILLSYLFVQDSLIYYKNYASNKWLGYNPKSGKTVTPFAYNDFFNFSASKNAFYVNQFNRILKLSRTNTDYITFELPLTSANPGTPPVQLTATSTNGKKVTFVVNGPAFLRNDSLFFSAPGSNNTLVTVTASVAGLEPVYRAVNNLKLNVGNYLDCGEFYRSVLTDSILVKIVNTDAFDVGILESSFTFKNGYIILPKRKVAQSIRVSFTVNNHPFVAGFGACSYQFLPDPNAEADAVEEATFFPNPTTDFVDFSQSPQLVKSVTVIDMNGVVRMKEYVLESQKISLKNLPLGTYLLKIEPVSGEIISKKIVKY